MVGGGTATTTHRGICSGHAGWSGACQRLPDTHPAQACECRLPCMWQVRETLGNILAACPAKLFSDTKQRHDRVLYVQTRTVIQGLGISLLKTMVAPGEVALAGLFMIKVLVDQVIPTKEQVSAQNSQLCITNHTLANPNRLVSADQTS